jgi:hypothetical protein
VTYLLGPLVGGLLAITGGLLVTLTSDRRERQRWRRDAQLKASVELLTALQTLVRRMIDLAYLADKKDPSSAVLPRYHDATVGWNSAMYEALLVSPPKLAGLIAPLDREVDRLLDQAMDRPWTRLDFRAERIAIGRLAAQYLQAARAHAGLPPIELASVWTWHENADAPSTAG